jgi:hypothetical protein
LAIFFKTNAMAIFFCIIGCEPKSPIFRYLYKSCTYVLRSGASHLLQEQNIILSNPNNRCAYCFRALQFCFVT